MDGFGLETPGLRTPGLTPLDLNLLPRTLNFTLEKFANFTKRPSALLAKRNKTATAAKKNFNLTHYFPVASLKLSIDWFLKDPEISLFEFGTF